MVLRDLVEILPRLEGAKPNNLPYPSLGELFVGRNEFLNQIKASVQSGKSPAITGNRATAVYGLGGIGKTRVVVEFAHQNRHLYNALLFVTASSVSSLTDGIAALCQTLDLQDQSSTETDVRYEAALRWLEHNQDWILILDNVDAEEVKPRVTELLARIGAKGHAIVTSRLADWSGSVKSLSLGVLTEEDAIAFLLKRTGDRRRTTDNDGSLARQIAVTMLGQLALALEQAGAMISQQRLTFQQYIDAWNSKHPDVLKWFNSATMHYPESVATTWQTTVDQLTEPAQKLFLILGFYSMEPIPESLLDNLPDDFGTVGMDLLTEIENFSLVTRAEDAPMFTVHRVVQDVARNSMEQNQYRKTLQSALEVVDVAYDGDPQDVRSWPILEPLTPHALTCSLYADTTGINEPTTHIFNVLGMLFLEKAQFSDAEPLLRRALEIDEEIYGQVHPKVATSLNNFAQLLFATNRLEEAEPLMRRALEIDEESYGRGHPQVAIRLSNLASLLRATHRLEEAEPPMRRALEIDENSYGQDHPQVARRLSNLASLLYTQNRFTEAEPLMQRALTIDETSYGSDHPNVALLLNNFATLLITTKRLAEAEPLLRRALAIDEKCYGTNHPNVARDLNNLAQLLQATNRLAEAEPLMRRALEIDEESFGPSHTKVALRYNNLALLLQSTKRLGEAEPLMRCALEILIDFTRSTKHQHPQLQETASNYCGLLVEMGQTENQAYATVNSMVPELFKGD